MNIKDIKEDIKRRIDNIQEIVIHQNIVRDITKGKGRTYEDSHLYKLGLQMGQAHLMNLLEQIEKNENNSKKTKPKI